MNVNVFSTGQTALLKIRYMGCNRKEYQVNIGPMLRGSYIIHYVTDGRGYYNGNPVETGQGFLITPGHVEEYRADPQDPWELLWVVSEDRTMESVFSAFDADPDTGIFTYDSVNAARNVADRLRLLPQRVISCAQMLELFLGIYKYQDRSALEQAEHPRVQSYVDFALDYIHMNYHSSISIRELTELLGVSQPYLFRIFKTATGKSPKQYLGDYRLLQAKKLLDETDLTVTQVASSVGYADALAFFKFFRLRQGVSPQTYRKRKE